jgi:hypothetical protein
VFLDEELDAKVEHTADTLTITLNQREHGSNSRQSSH